MQSEYKTAQRALVAGGSDFLALHLCRRLLSEGWDVYCIGCFSTGVEKNLSDFNQGGRLTVIPHDWVDPWPQAVAFDEIYYLACAALPARPRVDPVHRLRSCVDGAFHVLELARASRARVLLASSSKVYGDPHVHPQPEAYRGNVSTVGMDACFAEGIRCAESLFSDYGRRKRVVAKIARVFNTYGPLMSPDDGGVVPNFVTQALSGQNLTVYGDGTQLRSLCYVDDMVEGLIRLMRSPSAFRGPVNLGSSEQIMVLDIARQVRGLTGAQVSIDFRPLPPDDPAQCCPDIFLARHHLHWQPKISLDEGLRSTIRYFSPLIQHKQSHRTIAQSFV